MLRPTIYLVDSPQNKLHAWLAVKPPPQTFFIRHESVQTKADWYTIDYEWMACTSF